VQTRIYNNSAYIPGDRVVDPAWVGLGDPETDRASLRTRAWLSCCAHLKRLFTAVGREDNSADKTIVFHEHWDSLLEIAVKSGFYSTWLDVLSNTNRPSGVLIANKNLGAQFVYDTNPANNPNQEQTIPGTNYAEVP